MTDTPPVTWAVRLTFPDGSKLWRSPGRTRGFASRRYAEKVAEHCRLLKLNAEVVEITGNLALVTP